MSSIGEPGWLKCGNRYNFTFSINVHENMEFLLKQLYNINKYVIESYCVILNCNLFMYKELIKNKKIN